MGRVEYKKIFYLSENFIKTPKIIYIPHEYINIHAYLLYNFTLDV